YRGRDVRPLGDGEAHRQRARLEDEPQVLRLLRAREAGDARAAAADPARERGVVGVDLRERLDLVVEDDREVLRRPVALAARPLGGGDLLEDLPAVTREVHQHLRLARVGIDVGAWARELQVVARELRNPGGLVVREQVPPGPGGRHVGRADGGAWAARDPDGVVRDGKELEALRDLLEVPHLRKREERRLRRPRAGEELLLRVEEVPGRRLSLLRQGLDAGEEAEEAWLRPGHSVRTGGRSRHRRLEVV